MDWRLDLSVAVATAHYMKGFLPHMRAEDQIRGPRYLLGRVVGRHAIFGVDDVVVAYLFNGGAERCWVSGWSTKKDCAIGTARRDAQPFVMQYARWSPGDPRPRAAAHHHAALERLEMRQHEDRSPLQLLKLPDELRDLPVADPAVRAFALEAFRAAYAAAPVGTGSRGTFHGAGS